MQQIIAQTCIATGIFGLKLQKYWWGGGLEPPSPPRNYGYAWASLTLRM